MKILIIGAGMYVSGRSKTGPGTLLSSLAQISKKGFITNVTIVATKASNADEIDKAVKRINDVIGSNLVVDYQIIGKNVSEAVDLLCRLQKFDCAIVCVPDHLHFEYGKALISHKVPCLIVKPLVPTLREGVELENLASSLKVYAAVEFHKRWDITNLWIKKALQEKKLGKILYFTVDYSQKLSIPSTTFLGWSSKTNIFQYLGVHYVDLIWFLTGFKPVRVVAIGTAGALKNMGIDTWDSVHASIIWKNPLDKNDWFVSQLSTNWVDPECTSALSDQKYKVVGTLGRLECDQKNRGLEFVTAESGIQQINPYFSEYLPDVDGKNHFSGYGHESISRFIEDVFSLQNGSEDLINLINTRPSIKDALISTSVVDAVNRSLKNNFSWEAVNEIF